MSDYTDPFTPKFYKLNEAAEYLRVHPMTMYKLIKTGKIKAFKVGGHFRFTKEMLDEGFKHEA